MNGISLFTHNSTAYDPVVVMLGESGKASIVHPTGTGKSFIGFKLAEENPDAAVCWQKVFEVKCIDRSL